MIEKRKFIISREKCLILTRSLLLRLINMLEPLLFNDVKFYNREFVKNETNLSELLIKIINLNKLKLKIVLSFLIVLFLH